MIIYSLQRGEPNNGGKYRNDHIYMGSFTTVELAKVAAEQYAKHKLIWDDVLYDGIMHFCSDEVENGIFFTIEEDELDVLRRV